MLFKSLFPASALAGASSLTATRKPAEIEPVATTKVVAASATADVHDASYYAKCMMGGVLSCGLTHTFVVPLDLVKCRMQVDKTMYKGVFDGLRNVFSTGTFALGWQPTLIGYSMQGLCKFGFYELFKDLYADIVGRETAAEYKTLLFLTASASAELIADVALCPMESVKVRMQTSLPGTNFPSELGAAVRAIHAEQGIGGFYKSVVPLWMRQVPYTMVKFACFERTVEAFYNHVFTAGRDNYSKGTQLSITFASGYIAGVFCAIVSHPADSVVSKLNQSPGKGIGGILAELGPMGIWRGLVARIIMIGTLTGLQWWIYDSFKVAMGLSASGGGVKKVEDKK